MLNAEQLEAMGAHFLQVLLAMKHNGAIDKTRTGFIALCDRLLRSPDPRLSNAPSITIHIGEHAEFIECRIRCLNCKSLYIFS